MKPSLLVLAALLTPAAVPAAPADKAGCADHPLFPTRLPGYSISECRAVAFDSYTFLKMKAPARSEEGRLSELFYHAPGPGQGASALEAVRNYEAAITKAGGTVVDIDPRHFVYGKFVQNGQEIWAQAEARPGNHVRLTIVEKKPMTQRVVADAAAFGNDLQASGHAAVYGIYFDTAKAVVKPESTPALQEVAKLLAGSPGLKLWVVGHTDAVGAVEANMKLAQARADAVVAALTTAHGVAPERLKGYGVGPLAPVASNAGEDGRAKNRRVELVKQ